ncbi:MAG: hypothetical protein HN975_10790 [Anaerolineae bacterium]|jgi:hypothetical protein|nr:hypothetical protein [Anaerolineae bacterium]
MPITPKDTFDYAIKRADNFLTLYTILHNSRQRSGRSDWLASFKSFMRWPQGEKIVRIDGRDRLSLLILREELGIDRKLFSHDYVSELLRSSIVCVISALDRYMHDVVVDQCWTLLTKREANIPKELKKIRLPVLATKKALDKLKREPSSRPGTIIKQEIQKALHFNFTFQKKSDIEMGARLLGIQDFWRKVTSEMPDNPTCEEVQEKLAEITRRRNQIVHESDLIRKTSAKEISQRKIAYINASHYVKWIKDFVNALNQVFYLDSDNHD